MTTVVLISSLCSHAHIYFPALQPCTPASACSGSGECALGYETPEDSCVGCVQGYYKISGECKKCPALAGLFLGLYIGVVVIFGVFGLILVKKGPSIAVAGVGIDYYQVLSIFVSFDVRWPGPVKEVLNVVSISNMNIELVSPQCTVKFDYHQKWLAIEFGPIALILLGIVAYYSILGKKACAVCCAKRCGIGKAKERKHGKLTKHGNAMIGVTILMFQFIYIYCTKTAFEVFACEPKEDGREYMYFEPKIRCWEGNHLYEKRREGKRRNEKEREGLRRYYRCVRVWRVWLVRSLRREEKRGAVF